MGRFVFTFIHKFERNNARSERVFQNDTGMAHCIVKISLNLLVPRGWDTFRNCAPPPLQFPAVGGDCTVIPALQLDTTTICKGAPVECHV